MFELLASFLLHPHAWVRQTCSRILGSYFATLNPASFADEGYAATTLLGSDQQLFSLVRACCLFLFLVLFGFWRMTKQHGFSESFGSKMVLLHFDLTP
jgi:hypothetical protein